jgi:hypothetical protein
MKKKALFLMLVLTCVSSITYAAGGDKVWEYETFGYVFSSPAVERGLCLRGK